MVQAGMVVYTQQVARTQAYYLLRARVQGMLCAAPACQVRTRDSWAEVKGGVRA